MKVNLSKESFDHITIDFQGVNYKLIDGQDFNENPKLIEAFPQYFNDLTITDRIRKIFNKSISFVMSHSFITMLAMIMIAGSAISFDIDGWSEIYHRLKPHNILFMIVSLYIAKMAIIKILSVTAYREVQGKWNKTVNFINHFLLRTVMICSLLGMVFVSSVGIYSSLAVNTVGDAKIISMGDSKIAFIDKRISNTELKITNTKNQIHELEKNVIIQLKALDDSVPVIKGKIKQTKKVILELPSNYITKRRNMTLEVNKMNDEIFNVQSKKNEVIMNKANKIVLINEKIEKLQESKDALEDEKEKALIELNDKQVNESNKALNFTAELIGVPLLSLLKFINILMAFVLEFTYLALTWHFVRIVKE